MSQISKDSVNQLLRTILDPELGINIVDMGLIYHIDIKNNDQICIQMTLTTIGCPLGSWFENNVRQTVANGLNIDESQVEIEFVFDPPWTLDMMNPETRAELGYD